MARIRILGASGSGTSTLGEALARQLEIPHADSDSFYWLPTDPPFTTPRPLKARQALLQHTLPRTGEWVFSGAATAWTARLESCCDLIVFLQLDPTLRLARLRQREADRFGSHILPGGDMAAIHSTFIAWAESYDTAGTLAGSLATHLAWLADQHAPVLRLDSKAPVEHLVEAALEKLHSLL